MSRQSLDRIARRGRAQKLCALTLCAALAGVAGLGADAWSQSMTPDKIREQREAQAEKLRTAREQESSLAKSVEQLAAESAELRKRLVTTAGGVQDSEGRLTSIEKRLVELGVEESDLRLKLAEQNDVIAELLAALQRMGRNPPPVIATQRSDALTMVRSAMQLASVFPDLRDKALGLTSQIDQLVQVIADARDQSEKLRTEQQSLTTSQRELDKLLADKQQRLASNEAELRDVQALAKAQEKRVADLDELIAKLDQAVSLKSGLGEYEKELQEGTAPGQKVAGQKVAGSPPAGTQATEAQPVTTTEQPAAATDAKGAEPKGSGETVVAALPRAEVELRPDTTTLGPKSDHSRLKPAIPFSQARGLLPMPAQGRRIVGFGDKIRIGQSKGIVLETRFGAQITSPNDGWVVYSGEFRSYGQLLIINAGGGYHILLAGLARIDVGVGQFVVSGEPVGRMRAEIQLTQNTGSENAPVLYIELRNNGRPIDPDPWWNDGLSRVQG